MCFSYDDELNLVDVSIHTYYGETGKLNFWKRIKFCIRTLLTGNVYGDQLILDEDGINCLYNYLKQKREAPTTTHMPLEPFIKIAKGIPHNWPGECILRFDQRNDGSIYLSYYGVNDAREGITINQWRALLDVCIELKQTTDI